MARKYWGFMPNDFLDGIGITVSVWASGCPLHCNGCHNQKAWDPKSGYDIPDDLKERLKAAITANGINRNLSLVGGEFLAEYNVNFALDLVRWARKEFPDIKIFLWTGYTYEELLDRLDERIFEILTKINVLIDGPFELANRDLSLWLRGSTNQRVINAQKSVCSGKLFLLEE